MDRYYTPIKSLKCSCLPLPAPHASQVPKDLCSTILDIRIHPSTERVVKDVNDYFLEHWPFKTEKHRKRFVDEGYARFMCLGCPLSTEERLHWGCRLLILGFLIDDILDYMSVEEGVAHNSKVIECARGNLIPDRNVPAQYIMYDLFESMREVDLQLANELLESTIKFLVAQADGSRMKPMTLDEYWTYRYEDLGKR